MPGMESAQNGERPDPASLGARLQFALDLVETGVTMMRQNLRRENPHATEAEIQALLNAWLAESPLPPDPNLTVRESTGFP